MLISSFAVAVVVVVVIVCMCLINKLVNSWQSGGTHIGDDCHP